MSEKNIFKDIKTFKPEAWEDYRGDIWSSWVEEEYPNLHWRRDKFSTSRKNVLRGFHGDNKTWKLIQCVYGEFYLVVVDNRPDSDTYLKWDWWVCSARNKQQVLVPPNFGNAHLVLSDTAVFHYKLAYDGDYVDVDGQFVLKWNNPKINVNWPIDNPILQMRDR